MTWRIKYPDSSLSEDFHLVLSMPRNHPLAELRKADPRRADVGLAIRFGRRIGLPASNIFSCTSDFRSLARFFRLAAYLQIAAIALLLTIGPRSAVESQEFLAGGNSLISYTDGANCNAQAGDEAPAHPRRAHAQCCLTCTATGRDTLAFLIAGICIAGYCFARAAEKYVAYFTPRGFFPPVLGWASSWSSRAPPVFS